MGSEFKLQEPKAYAVNQFMPHRISVHKAIFLILSILFWSMSLCSCSSSSRTSFTKVNVGVTYYNQSDVFLNALLDELTEDLEAHSTDTVKTGITILGASGQKRTQEDQVEELIDAGCNVLCVNLVDRSDTSYIIDLAKENEIPIIFFNREPVEADMEQWDQLYYVGADARESGTLQGKIATQIIEETDIDRSHDGKIQYVVMEGELNHQDAIVRTEMSVKYIQDQGIELEKISYQTANWSRAQAQNRMSQLITEYPNQIELVLANNDEMAIGVVEAYRKNNVTQDAMPVVIGVDGTKEGLQAVVDGDLAGTVYNDKEGQAEAIADLCVALVTENGMNDIEFERDKYIYLPYEEVTTENVGDILRRNAK